MGNLTQKDMPYGSNMVGAIAVWCENGSFSMLNKSCKLQRCALFGSIASIDRGNPQAIK